MAKEDEDKAKAEADVKAAEAAEAAKTKEEEEAAEAAALAKADSSESEEEEGGTKDEEASAEDVWGYDGDDEVTKSVLELLDNAEVKPDEAKALLWDAVQAGDPTKVDVAALQNKVGKANATLIMAGIRDITTANNAMIAEVTKTVETAAGGKEQWEVVRTWARTEGNVSDKDMADYRAMIDNGGKQAEFAVAQLVSAYNADTNNTSLGGETMTGDTTNAPKVEGISRLEYGKRLDVALRRGDDENKLAQLKAQRAAGKKQGI